MILHITKSTTYHNIARDETISFHTIPHKYNTMAVDRGEKNLSASFNETQNFQSFTDCSL